MKCNELIFTTREIAQFRFGSEIRTYYNYLQGITSSEELDNWLVQYINEPTTNQLTLLYSIKREVLEFMTTNKPYYEQERAEAHEFPDLTVFFMILGISRKLDVPVDELDEIVKVLLMVLLVLGVDEYRVMALLY